MYKQNFDFSIPKKYDGEKIELPGIKIKLSVPNRATYLDVNPLEDEEEFLGFQGNSDRQQISYYDSNKKLLKTDDLDGLILTNKLMSSLEDIFKAEY